jgi:hypothetical protein
MFRHLVYGQVRMGEWQEFYDLYKKLEDAGRAKNLTPRDLWGPTVGTINAFMLTSDHATLDAWGRDNAAYQQDADYMKLWRAMGQLLDGPPEEELWETAVQIA